MKFEFVKMKTMWFFLFALLTLSAAAQQKVITGKVTDKGGMPIPGATIVVKVATGAATGSVTDNDGKYRVEVSSDIKTLNFSFVGMKSIDEPINGRSVINIVLEEDRITVDEVMVIGYGTVKKSDATGSVSTVSSKDFNKGGVTSAQDLIVGKSAGVVITNAGGAPGSGATIRIRGGSSLNASNDPLIIIDGVPIANDNISGSSNFLSFVNPNDIETFTVLKDASSTAIYGSRASNGVILITTKKGIIGSPLKITFNLNSSVADATKYMDVYSGDQIRQIALDHKGLFGADTYNKFGSANTNWQKEIFRQAVSQDHNVSISGALKNLPYRVSVGYTDQNGIMKNTEMERYTGSVSLNPVLLNGDLKVNMNAKGMITKQNFGDSGALGSAINMDPTQPVYDGNTKSGGYYQWSNYGANLGTPNPVEQLMGANNKSNVKRVIGNIQLEYKIPYIPDLKANLNLATDYTESKGYNNRPTISPSTLTGTYWGRLSDYNGKNYNNLLDFYLNYTKDLSNIKSKIDLTAGYSWQHFKRENGHYTRGFIDDAHPYQKPDSIPYAVTENYLVSFFGRLNYTYHDKYLLTVTVRDDGSSRFAKGNQWGLFPSAALAWKVKDESFLKDVNSVSNLKLRLGWGITGQQDIQGNDYPAQAKYMISSSGSYYPIGGSYLPTLRPSAYDPNIKWEQTTTSNIGIDFGFLKDRITGSIDLYKRVTDNLLNNVTIPSGSNFSNTLLTNVGSLENKGIEFTLNVTPISKKDMSLTLGFNFTYNKNKITKLLISDDPNYIGILYSDAFSGTKQVTRVGYPAYSYFLNKQVYDTNGKPIEGLYVDLSGKGGTVNGNNADKYIYKNPTPDYIMGFTARFNYKDFDVSASARMNLGNYVFNQVAASSSYDQMYQIGYWQNQPKYLSDTKFVKRQFTSDYFVENASFFKLDNLSVGYNFEQYVKTRLSFTVQNIFTITKYRGLDPEVAGGIDNNFYPRPRTFMLGISITL